MGAGVVVRVDAPDVCMHGGSRVVLVTRSALNSNDPTGALGLMLSIKPPCKKSPSPQGFIDNTHFSQRKPQMHADERKFSQIIRGGAYLL